MWRSTEHCVYFLLWIHLIKSFPDTQVGFLQWFKPIVTQTLGDTGVAGSISVVLRETAHQRGQNMQRESAHRNLPGFRGGCCFVRENPEVHFSHFRLFTNCSVELKQLSENQKVLHTPLLGPEGSTKTIPHALELFEELQSKLCPSTRNAVGQVILLTDVTATPFTNQQQVS